jgi:hypothetical protein
MSLPSDSVVARACSREQRARIAFAARAWVLAIPVEASLASVGLATTLRWIEAIPQRARAAAAVGVEDGERLVARAYRFNFVRGRCLPRSLVQYLVHRRDGVDARFVVGVRRPEDDVRGLEAHAWVEAPGARADVPFTELFASGGLA